jgi:hypothetical protein
MDLGLLPLTDEFVNGQYLYRFMIGEISADEANRELLKIVSDPMRYIVSWFDMAGKRNTFTKDMQASFLRIEEDLQKVIQATAGVQESLRSLRKLEREMYRIGAPAEAIHRHKEIRGEIKETTDIENALRPRKKLRELFGDFGVEVLAA